MKLKLFLLLCFWFSYFNFAQPLTLSPETEVSIITIGPGQSLNDAFGHNAFRIHDKKFDIDLVYGYGEYDFDAPNFYLKFAQGKLNYLISKDNFSRFYKGYVYQNRTIREQVLNLSPEEKQTLFNFLEVNYKPENRRYLYDFFYDNCATKIRDVVQNNSNDKVSFITPESYEEKTFRSLIYEHVDRNSWGSLGIDIALGSVIDKKASSNEHMFLPKYIFDFFSTAMLSADRKLVKQTKIIYQKKESLTANNLLSSPLFVMSIIGLIILIITYFDYKRKKRSKILDIALFGITGIIGVLILLLWFATDHSATAQNYNVLWAFPLNIIIILQLFKPQVKSWFIKYLKFLIIILALLTLHWIVGIQVYAISLIPILIGLCVRYLYLVSYYQQALK